MKFKKLGIRFQILLGFMIFTVCIGLMLWLFQITLLNNFYKAIKHNEVQKTASDIIENYDNENFVEYLQEVTKNTGIDIMITNPKGKKIISVSVVFSRFFSNLTPELCEGIYVETLSNGGEYIQWVSNEETSADQLEELFFVKTTPGEDGKLIILNTVVTPVNSTVDTLIVQLWCVTGFMIVLSLVLALALSRKIGKPLADINEGAKKLAEGDYETKFNPHGTRETCELAYTLNYASEELSKVENLRRELIANVSHDLRTPLTMISGYAEVMRDIPGENNPENVQVIIDEAKRLERLVNDLLDISKLEDGKTQYKPAVINLTKNIEDILLRYDKLVDYNFSFYHGEDVYVYADEIKISQVIYNLVNNAINYSGEDRSVVLKQIVEGNFVKIEIIDTGEGIDDDKIKDIWERYYKVDKSHKSARIGTGLGLSIVRKIMELHGGTYGVVSSPGNGSAFWISLPINMNNEEKN